jgi:hypothetical protein
MIMNIFLTMLFISSNIFPCQKWPYLQSPAFKKARQERVAHMVAECDTIVEIGGAGAPMSGFLSKDKKVIVIDPNIKRKEEGNITHIPKPFERWDEQPSSRNYAVVILGMQLVMPDGAWKKLHTLIDGSALTIIEYSAVNKQARKQFKDIQNSVCKEWLEPVEFEINGFASDEHNRRVFNHRVLQCTRVKQLKEDNE